ncbi:MAG: hypothetical protein OXL41_13675 [Nitrospinae bacterium]|nr:hypothetical protein [Nitrospinota bacterium]
MKDDKAKKQIQKQSPWIPAFAGMTAVVNSGRGSFFNNPLKGGSEKNPSMK